MRTRRAEGSIWLLLMSIPMLALAGCTHVYHPPKEPVRGYASTNKVPLTVELYLSDELRAAKWERQVMGDTFRVPLGEAFARNAEVVAREAFSEVVVTNGAAGPGKTGCGAVLIPRMVVAEENMAAWAFGSETLTVLLEWTLKNVQGNTVWVDTIKGEGEAHAGNVFTHSSNAEQRVKAMVEDLFRKSFQAMSSSRAIREFAAVHGKVAVWQGR